MSLICLSCLDNPNFPEPEGLIRPEKMSLILSDMFFMKGFSEVLKKEFSLKKLLEQEHQIDSLRLAKSIQYYESHPDIFLEILEQTESILKKKIK